MNNTFSKLIFLSYCWGNKSEADTIDNYFKSVGISLTRDNRNIPYAGSIKKFVNQIAKHDFVLMLLSDEYMKSENCMYEVTKLLLSHRFESKILPVTLKNTNVYNRQVREEYSEYWVKKIKEINSVCKKNPSDINISDKIKIESISKHLGRPK